MLKTFNGFDNFFFSFQFPARIFNTFLPFSLSFYFTRCHCVEWNIKNLMKHFIRRDISCFCLRLRVIFNISRETRSWEFDVWPAFGAHLIIVWDLDKTLRARWDVLDEQTIHWWRVCSLSTTNSCKTLYYYRAPSKRKKKTLEINLLFSFACGVSHWHSNRKGNEKIKTNKTLFFQLFSGPMWNFKLFLVAFIVFNLQQS